MKRLFIFTALLVFGGIFFLKDGKVQPKSPTKLNQLWLNPGVVVDSGVKQTEAQRDIAQPEGIEVMTMNELEREYQSLSLKEIDERLQSIEKSDELQKMIVSANERSLDQIESQKFVNLIRSKAVLIKLAIEKSMNEEDIL